jgi:hypothetical protein
LLGLAPYGEAVKVAVDKLFDGAGAFLTRAWPTPYSMVDFPMILKENLFISLQHPLRFNFMQRYPDSADQLPSSMLAEISLRKTLLH